MAAPRNHRKQVIVVLVFVLTLSVVVPPFVNANLFRSRLKRSIQGALGRDVTLGDVKIRLLPLPGFQIDDFVIADDAAFSSEPMLRAESVTARLRLTSLWRGRLEIARLSLAYPSLNLVKNEDGRWNIEGLLAHASQVSAAPTGKKRPETRPRFPYIEAENGRINFKVLQEKKAHALVEADFALWQESENQWNMRMDARPTRTDANLGDTGTLRIEGSFQRADKLENTPTRLTFDWQRAQLGQLTTLLYGRDRGWRGDVRISGSLEGTPRQFMTKGSIRIDDFHRYDIASDDAVRIEAECSGTHGVSSDTDYKAFRNAFTCDVPLGTGSVELRLFGQYWWHSPEYLSIRATEVPVENLAQLYRRAKRDVPRDITGHGILNGYFSRVTYPDAGSPRWIGQGAMTNLQLSSAQLGENFHVDGLRFGFSQVERSSEGPGNQSFVDRAISGRLARRMTPLAANTFTIDPFFTDLGGPKPVTVNGTNSPDGLELQAKGEADFARLSAAAQVLGLRLPLSVANPRGGATSVDLTISGRWFGFAAPTVTGNLKAVNRSSPSRAPVTASNQQHVKTTTRPRE